METRALVPADAPALASVIARGIADGDRIIALTGAGASADSGIAPFRAPGATSWLWSGVGAAGVFLAGTGTAWRWWPGIAHFFYTHFFKKSVDAALPNACHRFLAAEGARVRVLTTNVDDLHERAGLPEEYVVALHGSVYRKICGTCGGVNVPCCGPTRPAVLLFNDPGPNDVVAAAWGKIDTVVAHARGAKTWVFVVGVSWAINTLNIAIPPLRAEDTRFVHVNPCAPPTRYSSPDDFWVNETADAFFALLDIERARARAADE